MFTGIQSLLGLWFTLEPAASLMVCATALLLFGSAIVRLRREGQFISGLVTPFFRAVIHGLTFIGVVGAAYFLLTSSYKAFEPLAASLARGEKFQIEVESAKQNWGAPLTQDDLLVIQNINHETVREVVDLNGEIRYINESVSEKVEQESVIGFNGMVNVQRVEDRLNTYTLNAVYEYHVANQSDQETTATFQFPLDIQRRYENFTVLMDGREINSSLRIGNGSALWESKMQPHQQVTVTISYSSQGMEFFTYRIPNQRVIRDFSMTVQVDTSDIYTFSQPETNAIQTEGSRVDNGYRQSWAIDDSILAPYIGIIFKQKVIPDINQQRSIQMIHVVPRGLMFLAVLIAFTILICDLEINWKKFMLCIALCCGNFLGLMGLGLLKVTHPILLPSIALLTSTIVYFLYRDLPRLPRRLLIVLTTGFMAGYPYSGLLQETAKRTAFDSATQAFVILYIFMLALLIRVRNIAVA